MGYPVDMRSSTSPMRASVAPMFLGIVAVAGFTVQLPPGPCAQHRTSPITALSTDAGGGGMMKDGARIGPPPDMPSLLLNNRIVYLGMAINAQVTELIISELLFLQYDSSDKPILMYINSPGTTTEDGIPVGFETEAFAIADTMAYVQPPIHTVLIGKAYGHAAC